MKKLISLSFMFCSLLALSFAQQRIHVDHSCSFVGELDESDIYGFTSTDQAQSTLKRIMKYTGLPANFIIKAANVPNAAAVVYGSQRYILYNQYFMERVKQTTYTDWSAISILAHEIGHHLSGHTLDNVGSRPDKELEADRFSGFVLYKMGATLDEARVAMEKIGSERGSRTHPPKSARLAAITNGWLSAKELAGDTKPVKSNKPSTSTNSTKNYPKTPVYKSPATKFYRVWADHNQYQNGQKGMFVHAHFDANHLLGQDCRLVAWFSFQNGNKLRDLDGKNKTTDGQVSVSTSFKPGYEKTVYKDLKMFVPYDQLHLTGEGRFQLKFRAGISRNGKVIGDTSQYFEFWYEN